MTLQFLPEVAAKFYEALDRYGSRQDGLGSPFRGEVLDVGRLIAQRSTLWRERSGGYRRVHCPVFPYYVA